MFDGFNYLGSLITAGGVLRLRSHHELRELEQLSRNYDTCGVDLTPGFPSGERYPIPQFLIFYSTFVRHGLSAVRMSGDFVFDHQYIWTIVRVRWEHRVSHNQVRRHMLSAQSSPLTEIIIVTGSQRNLTAISEPSRWQLVMMSRKISPQSPFNLATKMHSPLKLLGRDQLGINLAN